ncbi:hypothetical protein JOC78_001073 [Bacillus ectoiniformans]|nr:hypothetical protein [Bacillus ectoiniformans]
MLRTSDIIAIIDKNSIDYSEDTLSGFEHAESVTGLSASGYKSVVITDKQLFLSPFSSGTIKKRINDHYSHESGL